jgi:hypothetical protein
LTRSIEFNFSHLFDGAIWKTLVATKHHALILEVRNSDKKRATFSAVNYLTQKFWWKDKLFDEPWWIDLTGVFDDVVFFAIYTDTANPDKKSILACDLFEGKLIWWNNDFSPISISDGQVWGVSSKFGTRNVALSVVTGEEVQRSNSLATFADDVIRPQQYLAEHPYFDTVKTFLNQKFNLIPITALEYLEHGSLIFVSCYIQEHGLTNYFFIISDSGQLLLKEKLDEHTKGIGLDTFFIFSGCVFFVKNKVELVSYKMI